jgi:hypothetical protein
VNKTAPNTKPTNPCKLELAKRCHCVMLNIEKPNM